MPDGTVVAMPDQITPELGARLRQLHDDHVAGINRDAAKGQIERPPITDLREPGTYAPGSDPNVRAEPWTGADANIAPPPDKGIVNGLVDTAKGITGLAEQVPAGVGASLGAVRSLTDFDNSPATHTGPDFLQPHTDAGKLLQQEQGKTVQRVLDKVPDTPLTATLKERIPQALGVAGVAAPAFGAVRSFARTAAAGGGGEAAIEAAAARGNPAPGTVEHPVVATQKAGFQIAPNDVAKGSSTPLAEVPGSTMQKISETPETEANRNQFNTTHATKIASREINVPETDLITPEHIAEAKKVPGATYTRIGESVPSVQKPLDATKAALQAVVDEDRPQFQASPAVRRDVQRQLAGLESGKTSGSQLVRDIQFFRDDGSEASLGAAAALEKELEHQLTQQNPKGLAEYQAAREQFAKIYDVEAATQKTGGRLDPQALAAREAKPDHPGMTGGLADITNAARAAPNSVRLPGIVKGGETPYSKVGVVTNLVKAGVRHLVPDQTTPARQAAMADAAGPARPLPGGPQRSGIVVPRQSEMLGPNGDLTPPPGVVTPGATPPPGARPDFSLVAPPGGVIEPLQREAAVPQATGPLNFSKQVQQQLRLRDENPGPGGGTTPPAGPAISSEIGAHHNLLKNAKDLLQLIYHRRAP